MGRVISVVSGKGGVGKTTLAANLGAYLSSIGKNVLIVDANLSGANLGLHLDLPDDSLFSLNMILKGQARVSDATYRHLLGFEIIPASIIDMHINPKRLKHILRRLSREKDFIIIDSAPGINDEASASIESSDEVILVTVPEMPSIIDILRSKVLAEAKGKKILGVVVNRVNRDYFEIGPEHIEDILELPIIASIPENKRVRESVYLRRPVVAHFPKSEASVEMKRLAYLLMGEELPENGLWEKLMAFFGRK